MTAPVSEKQLVFGRAAFIALGVDLACILLFVAMGKENHGVQLGVGWFFNVWWPLALAWLIGMWVTKLYTRPDRWLLRLVGTVTIAVVIGGPLRTLTNRPLYSVFTLVAFGFLSLATIAWRFLRIAFRQARATPA